jgi:formylglycine-generating enzyme required for sulfatase activity
MMSGMSTPCSRLALLMLLALPLLAQANPNPAQIDWQRIVPAGQPAFEIARTETTIGQFRRFAEATRTVTRAERNGGGETFEAGWTQKPGWTWRTPFGPPARGAVADDEPAVHITFDEAQAFCAWAAPAHQGRLPSDAQWVAAAYTETRDTPTDGLVRGQRYRYPTGDSPQGAQCLGDCGGEASARAIRHGANLPRGEGHALAGSTRRGVNGLFEMGANAWEWVDEPPGDPARPAADKRTRGGSWWYGAAQMRADHLQGKPPQTAVVYIGFRCVRNGR